MKCTYCSSDKHEVNQCPLKDVMLEGAKPVIVDYIKDKDGNWVDTVRGDSL
jgi:hypothetical protein